METPDCEKNDFIPPPSNKMKLTKKKKDSCQANDPSYLYFTRG